MAAKDKKIRKLNRRTRFGNNDKVKGRNLKKVKVDPAKLEEYLKSLEEKEQ